MDTKLIAPKQKTMQTQIQRIQQLEKTVLMLKNTHMDDNHMDKAFPIICDLFLNANPKYFPQFRQWTLVYLEHNTTTTHQELMDSVYKKKLNQSPHDNTFWTLQLQSLAKQLKLL